MERGLLTVDPGGRELVGCLDGVVALEDGAFRIKEIIDAEDKSKPLSDEALAAALKEKGIEIARRTVVKYRQQLDIPPARRRKVFGGAGAG